MNITITGPRSVGKSTIAKLLAKKLKLKYLSSDNLGEKHLKKHGGLDKAIKSGKIKEFIKKKGYTLILKEYNKKDFVFDLSIGAFASQDFKKASRDLRKKAKQKSLIIGLLPSKKTKESVDLLFSREAKRKHFKKSDKKALFDRTKKRYPIQRDALLKNCDKVIYTGNQKPKRVVKEILEVLT